MAYAVIPEATAMLLVRALGLLYNQAGIYGPSHAVTQGAVRSVFAELEQALKTFGPIEIAVGDNLMLVNGAGEGLGAAAGKNLYDRMALYKLGGLLFTPPLDQREFFFVVHLFGTPPIKLAADGGFEAVLKRANLRTVRAVSVAYQRVSGDEPAVLGHDKTKSIYFSAEPAAPRAAETLKSAKPGMLDLSAALAGAAPLSRGETREAPEQAPESASQSTRRERAHALATMLRDAAAALDRDLAETGSTQEVSRALGRIREALSDMAAGSRHDITVLASEVDEDSKTIASIESAARRRGIGLKLTRGDLINRYAELNQEIVQPLTVSTGVIDLLQSGKSGELNDSQRELLKMAAEGVERVNQLVAYMNRISGLPSTYTPNADLISETYR
jgi:hypothetical protein